MIYTNIEETDITNENPLVMYIIVNEELNMSPGKLGAQIAHAAQMILFKYQELEELSQRSPSSALSLSEEECNIIKRMDIWLNKKINGGFRKVTLKADSKEWNKIKNEFGDKLALVIDAGLTQIPSGSETVIMLYPLLKGENKIIKRLQVLT